MSNSRGKSPRGRKQRRGPQAAAAPNSDAPAAADRAPAVPGAPVPGAGTPGRDTAGSGSRGAGTPGAETPGTGASGAGSVPSGGSPRPRRSRRASDAPVDALPARSDRSPLTPARDGEASDEAAPLTRRQLRLRAQAPAPSRGADAAQDASLDGSSVSNVPEPSGPEPAVDGREPQGAPREPRSVGLMTVEEALAARARTAGNPAPEPLAATPSAPPPRAPAPADSPASAPPETGLMDLEQLARQRDLAARAPRSSHGAGESPVADPAGAPGTGPVPSDPFTGAMNVLRDPQGEKRLANTGVDGPRTSGFHLELPPRPSAAAAEAAPRGVSAVVPRADEAEPAFAAVPETDDARPVRADGAQGLEPLDYLTGGARRARIRVLAVTASLVLGGIAFVTGLMMIINSR